MKIYEKLEQGTDEWLSVREGKLTASHAQAIGSAGKGLDTYVLELMAELHSTGERENYTNPDIERGHELEELARDMFELETGKKVVQVGFIDMDKFTGCSPDGLIDEDGMIEIKSVNDKNHFKLMLEGLKGIESKYLWQMQMQMLVSERSYCYYVSYNPNFEKSLIIHKIEKDDVKIEKLILGIEKGKKLIQEIKQKLDEK